MWLEADGQKHMHACCHRDQLERSQIIFFFWLSCTFYLLFCCRAGPISKQSKQSVRDWTNDLGGLQGACTWESSYWLGSMQAFLPLVSLSPSHFLSNLCFFANPPLCSGRAAAMILILINKIKTWAVRQDIVTLLSADTVILTTARGLSMPVWSTLALLR